MEVGLLLKFMFTLCLLQARRGVAQDLPKFIVHPQSSIYNRGTMIVLKCATDDLSDTIQWKLDGSEINVSVTAGTLTIDSFSDDNAGYYACVATRTTRNGSFTVSSAQAYIVQPFLKSPFDDGMRLTRVDSGDYAILPCIPEYTSAPAPRFTWYSRLTNGHLVTGLTPPNLGVYGPNGLAVLRRVERAQIYMCELDNTESGESLRYTTEVTLSENTSIFSGVAMLVPPEDAMVNEGDPLYLFCIATNSEPVAWSLNGEAINGTSHNVFIASETSVLIPSVDRTSTGIYTCSHPTLGQYSATVSIRNPPAIIDPPAATLTVVYGDQLNLKCIAMSATLYQWYLNGTKLSDNTDSLHRDSVTHGTAGTYQCYVYNEAGNDSFATYVNILAESPSIILTASPPKLSQFIGRSLTILCGASGFPPPVYSWSFNGNPIEQADMGNLTIDTLESTDGGIYTCNAFNGIGSPATTSTQVCIVDLTSVEVVPSVATVFVGQELHLYCSETHDVGASVELSWLSDGELVEDSGRMSLAKAGSSLVLRISNTSLEDAGEYSCQANTTLTNYTVESLAAEALSIIMVTVSPAPLPAVATPFTGTVWLIASMAAVGIVSFSVACVVAGIAYRSKRRRGKYSINDRIPSKAEDVILLKMRDILDTTQPNTEDATALNCIQPMTKDVVEDYENRKKNNKIAKLTNSKVVHPDVEPSAVTHPTTVSRLAHSYTVCAMRKASDRQASATLV